MFGAIGNGLGRVTGGVGRAAGSAGAVGGRAIGLPAAAVGFTRQHGELAGSLLRYQLAHPTSPDVKAVIQWAHGGQVGPPPTDDPDLLRVLIASRDPRLAAALAAYLETHPDKWSDVVAVEKWLIASQGHPRTCPPTRDPRLLGILGLAGARRLLEG